MRIGNIDDLGKTGNTENLINIIQTEEYRNPSKAEKWRNWWYYYKWYVICGIVVLGIACNLIGNALGLWHPSPDIQIAYVGETPLPQDTVTALESAFASIGGDFNGDGKVTIKINQYASNSQNTGSDAVYYGTASEITLIGDISDCESYFFLWTIRNVFNANSSFSPVLTEAALTKRIIPPTTRFFYGQTVLHFLV